MRALLGILLVVVGFVTCASGFVLTFMGDNHVFSVGGGEGYYGLIVVGLIPVGALLIPIGWSITSNNVSDS